MTVEYYDLGQRLRAAATGTPTPRMLYAPCLRPTSPVAVTVARGRRGAITVEAVTADGAATASGSTALDALARVGVTTATMPRTLIVADRHTLTTLARAARANSSPATVDAAAIIAWWEQRAEHPGSGAVLPLVSACRERWALGTDPRAEREIGAWLSWLRVQGHDGAALLHLADVVSSGPPLPGLDVAREADARSWDYFGERLVRGYNWRRTDTRTEAALGLATRSDATELYSSLRMRDPLAAVREQFAGNLVTGTVLACAGRGPARIASTQPLCRLRPDTDVQGWRGTAVQVPSAAQDDHPRLTGHLSSVTTNADQSIDLTIDDVTVRHGQIVPGDVVTLRTAAVNPNQQSRGRHNLRARYTSASNWLSSGADPVVRRREVPLDVAIAAADDDDR